MLDLRVLGKPVRRGIYVWIRAHATCILLVDGAGADASICARL